MNACFTGLTTGMIGSLRSLVGLVSAGSMGDTKNSPLCSRERTTQKARSKKFVDLSDAGSQIYPAELQRFLFNARPRGVIPSGSRRFRRAHADLRPPAHLP